MARKNKYQGLTIKEKTSELFSFIMHITSENGIEALQLLEAVTPDIKSRAESYKNFIEGELEELEERKAELLKLQKSV
jgi:hypothetical protein